MAAIAQLANRQVLNFFKKFKLKAKKIGLRALNFALLHFLSMLKVKFPQSFRLL